MRQFSADDKFDFRMIVPIAIKDIKLAQDKSVLHFRRKHLLQRVHMTQAHGLSFSLEWVGYKLRKHFDFIPDNRHSQSNTNIPWFRWSNFMFLWQCIVSRAWRKNTNKMQQYRCLLSIQMFNIGYCLNMFRASLCPSSGEKTTCYCIWGIFAGSVGRGWLRYCGATL